VASAKRSATVLVVLWAATVVSGAAAAPPADLQARIDALVEKMGTSDMAGKAAHDELVRIGTPAVPALLKAADDRRPLRRWWAISALCTIGDTRAIDVVLRHMDDPHPTVRHTAIYHGKAFVKRDRRVAEALMRLLDSPDAGSVGWAAEGLGRARHRPAIPGIKRAAEHTNPKVRWRSLEALRRIDGVGSISFFAERLRKDTEPALRRLAAGCLTRTRVSDRRTLGALVGALRDRAPEVRVGAWRGLRQLTGQTFDLEEPIRDVPRDAALKAVQWWLANRQDYPAAGKPSPARPTSRPASASRRAHER